MRQSSAYELIKANIEADGKLPHVFTLDEKPAPNQIGYMPGAIDGIGVYHMGSANKERVTKKVSSLLKKYFKTNKERYISKIEEVLSDSRAIFVIDPVLENIHNSHKRINLDSVLSSGVNLAKTSGNIEIIKIAIGLLGLLELSGNEDAREIIATLGLYEDFTLYAVVAAAKWPNGNDIIFKIAQKVTGWGKIHAVERLEPENDEIREWILRNGCSNDIMDAYLGLTCAVKGDLISSLRQNALDDKLFNSVAIIIEALLDEGPASGISEYEHAKEALELYMCHAQEHVDSVVHLWHMLNLRNWAKSAEVDYKDKILAQCNVIIDKFDWKEKIVKMIEQPADDFNLSCACNAASRLDVDVSTELFALVKKDPLKYSWHMVQLLKNLNIATEIIDLCETILPLDNMAEGMGDYLFSDKLNQEHQCLAFVLPELAAYPMQGIKLIQTGLNSRVTRDRNMACRALSGWVKTQGKPLADISAKLYSEIVRIYDIEVNEQTKETMKKLIDGGYEDYEAIIK
ncbi:MAG: hypothetical protein FWD25_13115 [Clostridia bacterium]|nr:hypothetical protein [Clostridia bacterium]